MDLITKLPKTPQKFDAIWVIVDRLTKSALFLAIWESSTAEQLAEIYVKEVVSRHGVPVSIISDRDVRFTSQFWERFHSELGTRLHLAPRTTLRQTVRASVRFRPWRTCFELVFWISEAVGIRICPWRSFRITTVTIRASGCRLLRCSTEGDAVPLSVGVRSDSAFSVAPRLFRGYRGYSEDSGTVADSSESAKELCGSAEVGFGVSGGRSSTTQGFPMEGRDPVSKERSSKFINGGHE
ncbi:hypothetical protein OSB04_011863 [Centaurea solstitialis]|uniref:Integrase catalytic domain-containing protein n=1 Tax=Centaurea solstitialis TaxID=347529 RepID=A0AA38TA89_9ASTR|nr:hypothetical protein OSB04_011863 [Centaurea solstitialis]